MLRREGENVPSEQRMDVQLGGLMVTHCKILRVWSLGTAMRMIVIVENVASTSLSRSLYQVSSD